MTSKMNRNEGKSTNTKGGRSSSFPRFNQASLITSPVIGVNLDDSPLESLKLPSNSRDSVCLSSKGLTNEPGQNNCFMNCPIQILWHLNTFRKNFRLLVAHCCSDDNCIFCSLKLIFTNYQFGEQPILSSDVLRKSMAFNFWPQQKFQLGSMNDASECYETILECLHDHLVTGPDDDDDDYDDGAERPPCSAPHCLTHNKMSLLVSEQTVCSCGSRSPEKRSFQTVYHVTASAVLNQIRNKKNTDLCYAEKLCRARSTCGSRPCHNPRCNRQAQRVQTLLNNPEVVTVGIVWDTEQPDAGHVIDIINSIESFVITRDFFQESSKGSSTSRLEIVGLLSYKSRHYCVFLLQPKQRIWYLYDDDAVTKLDNNFETVKARCCCEGLQPLLVIYANSQTSTPLNTDSAVRATFIRSKKASGQTGSTEYRRRGSFTRHPSYRQAIFRNHSNEQPATNSNQNQQNGFQPSQTSDLSIKNSSIGPPNISKRSSSINPANNSYRSSSTTSSSSTSSSSFSRSPIIRPESYIDNQLTTRKTVRFRREVEGSSINGDVSVSLLKGPYDDKVVSVPQMSPSLPSKQGIRKNVPAVGPAPNETSKDKKTFSQMTKEFLSNKTLDPGEAEDYIDPKLVHSIVAKTVPKLQSHSGVYSSTSGPFHKSRPVNTHLEQDQVKNDRGPHSDLPRDIGSTSEKIRLPTSQRFVRSRSNV